MASTKKQASARNKPPKSRPQTTSTISQPETQDLSPFLSSFSPDASLFALVTLAFDKHRLRVYNTSSQRAVAEYTIASGRVTSLSWSADASLSPSVDTEMSSPEKKRKKKKTEQTSSEDNSKGDNVVVLGLSDGTVSFFSPRHSEVVKTLSDATSSSAVLATSIHHKHTSWVWTSSADSTLRLWDIPTSTIISQLKNPNRLPYTSISIGPSNNDLLAAHHQIALFSPQDSDQDLTPDNLEEFATFTGHASTVRSLHWSKSGAEPSRFFSAAENDRFVYMWTTTEEPSTSVRPTANVSLDSDVREFVLLGTGGSSQELFATLSTSGKVSIIPVPDQLPADSKKAHTLRPRVTIGSAAGKRAASSPPPLVSLTFKDSESVIVARLVRGVKPVFDVVRYVDEAGAFLSNVALPEAQDLSAEEEAQLLPNRRYGESSAVAIGTGADLDRDGDDAGPEIEGALDVDLAELSLGQRLMAVNDINMAADSDDDDQTTTQRSKSRKGGKSELSSIPANSLTRTVIQALHSSDSRLLEMCLAHTDIVLIQNTVQRLPPQLSVPLITACVERLGRGAKAANMKGRGGGASSQRGTGLINWIKAVLAIHAGHLMAMPDLVARLSGLHSTLTARLNLYESLLSLNGRLDMVLSQIEMRSSKAPTTLSLPDSKGKAGSSKNNARHYIEGESDGSDGEEETMEVDVDGDSEGEGSVEDIELGGDSESDEGELSDGDEESGDSAGDSEDNEFIDDEAEEDEEDELSGSESE